MAPVGVQAISQSCFLSHPTKKMTHHHIKFCKNSVSDVFKLYSLMYAMYHLKV